MLYNTIAIKSIHKRSGIQSTNNTINKKKNAERSEEEEDDEGAAERV